jgi:hypothetical protein
MADAVRTRRTTVKTPRIPVQPSGGISAQNSNQSNRILLPLLPTQTDANGMLTLKQHYRAFCESLSCFLSHNGAMLSSRSQFSQQSTDVDHLFELFFQIAGKHNGSMPSITRSSKSPCASSIQQSSLPFLKAWQSLAMNVLRISKTVPVSTRQTMESHFGIIASALEAVGHANLAVTAVRIYRSLHGQCSSLQQAAFRFLDTPDRHELLKRLETEVKAFSQGLNEAFSKDFAQSGIVQHEIVRLRTRSYAACCDLIHQLRSVSLFETDMIRVIDSVRDFQTILREVLMRFNVTTSFLVPLSPITSHAAEEEEEEQISDIPELEHQFDVDLEFIEFVRHCAANKDAIGRSPKSYSQMFSLLTRKADSFCGRNDLAPTISEQNRRIDELRSGLLSFVGPFGESLANSPDDQLIRRAHEIGEQQQTELRRIVTLK